MIMTLFYVINANASIKSQTTDEWQIVPVESSLSFTGTQNGAPVSGHFQSFSGKINFDPNQLDKSNVQIFIDMGSIFTPYGQVADTLKTSDWFNIKAFPQAIFKATQFTKLTDNNYQANGTLTLRDKTLPLTIIFTLQEYTNKKAKVQGSTSLHRTLFGIGQGDWANTMIVKDKVDIQFSILATKK